MFHWSTQISNLSSLPVNANLLHATPEPMCVDKIVLFHKRLVGDLKDFKK